ncbi:hypothetical protein ACLBR5_24260 [Escherichia coli]
MTQKIEQSQRARTGSGLESSRERDLAAFQNSPKQTYQAEKRAIANCAPTWKKRFVALVYRTA